MIVVSSKRKECSMNKLRGWIVGVAIVALLGVGIVAVAGNGFGRG